MKPLGSMYICTYMNGLYKYASPMGSYSTKGDGRNWQLISFAVGKKNMKNTFCPKEWACLFDAAVLRTNFKLLIP